MTQTTSIQELLLTEDFLETKKTSLKSKIKNLISKSDEEIMTFFSDYIAWNGVFGGAVSSLAGKWHNAVYLNPLAFADEDEVKALNKYAHRVASEIFAAAEDEYNDENNLNVNVRVTHKDMAWHFYKNIMDYYGVRKRPEIEPTIFYHIDKTLDGYGASTSIARLKYLIKFLGFHIGSEKIASFEFDYLFNELQQNKPQLCDWLDSQDLVIDGEDTGITAMEWLRCHGSVEEEHFQHAINAALIAKEMVLKHKLMPEKEFNMNLSIGFHKFSDLQNSFFEKY